MDINVVRAFFKWCTILNGALLIFYSLLLRFAGDWVFDVSTQWIPVSQDVFMFLTYGLLGFLKIVFIALNLVPYLALVIIGRGKAGNESVEGTPAP